MPSRSVFSSGGRRRITSARSARETLALADQIRSAAARFISLVASALFDLTAVVASTSAQTWNRNSRTPSWTGTSLSILRSSIVYWIAIVSRCSTCCGERDALLRRLVLVLEVVLEELLELGQHGLEDAPAGVGIRLDDLDDALDLLLEQVADGAARRVEAHHARAHAVDQPARRMLDGGEEVGLGHGDAQHRHLQPREPDAHRRRDRVFHQDALEQQGDDLDRRPLDRRRGGLLERLLPLVQLLEQRRRVDAGAAAARRSPVAPASRRATLSCASTIAAFRRGDGGAGACEVTAKSGSWRPTSRFRRPSTASAWSLLRARPAARVIRRVSSPTSLDRARSRRRRLESDGAARRHAGRRAEAAGRSRSAAAGRRGSSGG